MRALALLVVALAVVGVSARPANAFSEEIIDALKLWSNGRLEVAESVLSGSRRCSDSEEDSKFFLVKQLDVPPHLSCEFAKASKKLKEELESIKSVNHFQVTKTLTDNRLFFTCEEWDSKDAFLEYIKKEDTEGKKLFEYIQKNDISFKLTQLIPISEALPAEDANNCAVNHGRIQWDSSMFSNAAASANKWMMNGVEEDEAIMLIKMIVKPSELGDLFGEVKEFTAKTAEQEEEPIVFAWKKAADDDFTVWGYAEWKSCEAARKHLETEHFKRFRSYVLQHDILVSKTPLKAVVKMEDEC